MSRTEGGEVMTAEVIDINEWKKLRGRRHRTRALGTKPLEQEPVAKDASPATELRQAYDAMKEALKERDRLILELDKNGRSS
jgi:hypothetical protein